MVLKKKTGAMLIAASAAAVVGIAAVSFAAWIGGKNNITAAATTGEVQYVGFAADAQDLTLGTIVPYNQPAATIVEGSTVLNGQIPDHNVYKDTYTIKVSYVTAPAGDLAFYVMIDENAEATVPADPANDTNWHEVTTTGASINMTATLVDGFANVKGKYVHFVLVSEELPESEQTVNFKIELVNYLTDDISNLLPAA